MHSAGLPLLSLIASSLCCEDFGNFAIQFDGTSHSLSKIYSDKFEQIVTVDPSVPERDMVSLHDRSFVTFANGNNVRSYLQRFLSALARFSRFFLYLFPYYFSFRRLCDDGLAENDFNSLIALLKNHERSGDTDSVRATLLLVLLGQYELRDQSGAILVPSWATVCGCARDDNSELYNPRFKSLNSLLAVLASTHPTSGLCFSSVVFDFVQCVTLSYPDIYAFFCAVFV